MTLDACSEKTRALVALLIEHDRDLSALETGEVTIHVGPRGVALTIERRLGQRPWPAPVKDRA